MQSVMKQEARSWTMPSLLLLYLCLWYMTSEQITWIVFSLSLTLQLYKTGSWNSNQVRITTPTPSAKKKVWIAIPAFKISVVSWASKKLLLKYEVASDQLRWFFKIKFWGELEVTAHTKWKKTESGSWKLNTLRIQLGIVHNNLDFTWSIFCFIACLCYYPCWSEETKKLWILLKPFRLPVVKKASLFIPDEWNLVFCTPELSFSLRARYYDFFHNVLIA